MVAPLAQVVTSFGTPTHGPRRGGSWVFSIPPLPPPWFHPLRLDDGRWALHENRREQPIPKTARKSKRIRRWMLPRCLLTQHPADGIGRRTFLLTTDRLQKISGFIIRHSPTPQHEGFRRRPPARQPPGDPTASARLSLDCNGIRSVDFWRSGGEIWDGQRVVPFSWELPWQTPTLPTSATDEKFSRVQTDETPAPRSPAGGGRVLSRPATQEETAGPKQKRRMKLGADRVRRLPFVHGALLSAPSNNGWCSFTNPRSPGHGTPHRMKKGGV